MIIPRGPLFQFTLWEKMLIILVISYLPTLKSPHVFLKHEAAQFIGASSLLDLELRKLILILKGFREITFCTIAYKRGMLSSPSYVAHT
jgi:hypothetical protein